MLSSLLWGVIFYLLNLFRRHSHYPYHQDFYQHKKAHQIQKYYFILFHALCSLNYHLLNYQEVLQLILHSFFLLKNLVKLEISLSRLIFILCIPMRCYWSYVAHVRTHRCHWCKSRNIYGLIKDRFRNIISILYSTWLLIALINIHWSLFWTSFFLLS